MQKEPSFDENQYVKRETIVASDLKLSAGDKEVFETLTQRIEEYREACKYMMSVTGDRQKAGEFLKIAENCKRL